MRSLEQSHARLGMEPIDVVLIHDVDIRSHGEAEAYERPFGEAMEGAYQALDELRSANYDAIVDAACEAWRKLTPTRKGSHPSECEIGPTSVSRCDPWCRPSGPPSQSASQPLYSKRRPQGRLWR